MAKIIKNLIVFFVFLLIQQVSFCYTLEQKEIVKTLNNYLLKEAKENLKDYSSDIELNITGIPINPVVTSENICPKIEIVSQDTDFKINSYKRVYIKNSNGNTIKSFPINVQTNIYKNVLIASKLIKYNEKINSDNTIIERKEISRYLGKTLSDVPNNTVATKNYAKGNIIINLQQNQTKQRVISKNSIVDIVFLSKNLTIKLQGRALKDGAIGDAILVRSDKYNKVYNAIIKSSNEVVVRI